MRYMVIEQLKDARAIYVRLRDRGRMMPAGLSYLDSWIAADLTRCFQSMECDDPEKLRTWMAAWEDLMDFEIVPVISSSEASASALGD